MAQERFIVLRLLKQEQIKQKICEEDRRVVACLRSTALNFVNLHQDSNTFAILSGSNFRLQYLVAILAVDSSNPFAILSSSNFFICYCLLWWCCCFFFFSSEPHSNQHSWTGHPLINIVQNKKYKIQIQIKTRLVRQIWWNSSPLISSFQRITKGVPFNLSKKGKMGKWTAEWKVPFVFDAAVPGN